MYQILKVSEILFMGDTISSYFKDGTKIDEKDPDEITSIQVFKDDVTGKLWTSDNSALYVLKIHQVESILCQVKNKESNINEFNSLMRNRNAGKSIRILKNDGKWEMEYFNLKSKFPNFKMTLEEYIENKKNINNMKKEFPKTVDFSDSFNKSPLDDKLFKENITLILPVNKIYFLQEKISSYFHDGSSIHKKDPSEVTQLEVLYSREEKKLYSINNRSLYVLKKNNAKNVVCLIRLKENHETLYLRRNINCEGTRITIINNFETFQEELRTINQRSLNNFNNEEWLEHKLNFKKQNKIMIDTVNFDDDTEKYINKKRKRDSNYLEDLFKLI
jgi:hypothetical protein